MTLAELGVLLRALEPTRLRATRVHADADADALVAAARGPGIVLLNYHMTSAGQPPFGGHVSPIGAYHAPSRRLLVLDVWPRLNPSGATPQAARVGVQRRRRVAARARVGGRAARSEAS